MPELKNEIPTDSELHEYFLEHFSFTVEGEMFAPPKRGESPELTAGCNRIHYQTLVSDADSSGVDDWGRNRPSRPHTFSNGP